MTANTRQVFVAQTKKWEKQQITSVFQTTAIKEWAISFNSSVIDDSASLSSAVFRAPNINWVTHIEPPEFTYFGIPPSVAIPEV